MRVLSLNTSEDQQSFPEMTILTKIMKDLNVGGLPEQTLTYDQVNYFRLITNLQARSNGRALGASAPSASLKV